jgi:arsenical pump membrane protein
MADAVVACAALAAMVAIALAWRHRAAAPAGAVVGCAVLAAAGLVGASDLVDVGRVLWRPMVTITAVMAMTACAHHVGLIDRLAAVIEPRTRGPVRHAFRVVFALAALTAAALSNDAAILLMTPTVIALLRAVYPKRHPKFVVPFAFAVFYAAGVAPLVTSNPMNLVVAEHAGMSFNRYAVTMIPVAVAGWAVAYGVLAWRFRDVLADESPALGAHPPPPPLAPAAWIVLAALAAVLVAYPLVSLAEGPLWLVASIGALCCVTAAVVAGARVVRLAGHVSWEILPFLAGVAVVALGLSRAGVIGELAALYRDTPAPLATVGGISALGSAALNNHPMALINLAAVEAAGGTDPVVLAGLVGGDLGPRLLPIGSLAGLLWLGVLRAHGVAVRLRDFVTLGVLVTVPSLAISLVTLWLVG